ncbi:DUF2778 domain-containing protein [Klebsiella aerogenes]|jgi:hypothetical protein|uniref:DUF2778 domain-containing protein n=1 Tax=Klebsiella TaxID=570 RepID=UPI0005F00020|nr:DUF2778 domain-containing protein [Klebsiella aerogenes]MCL6715139.1 DUF2778 domain-containing protein [Klebsiella sp. T2.Ur]AWD03238.1 DUF2778 domain-containing protein [Klebsiella aerogenes]EIV2480832.1 DUF2778 domain-containing protein [Klebsiella aerogenes]EIY2648385.1 DUF2778 domain-containing protein [Klebsiella aerogenes]EJC6253875.1 DUF2778 domain-containing protein [Klebsiella aerogenes]
MQICRMNYNDLSPDGRTVKLHCYGVGSFDVLSGIDRYINNPNCSDREKAAIPPGTYWIVDRPVGSIVNQVRAEVIDMAHLYKNHHSEWFGLFSNDTMSDHIFVNGMMRGSFRLHPLNTDGSGVSWGCITLYKSAEFQILRHSLLNRKKVRVPGGRGLMAYGRIDVQGIPDYSKCVVSR